MSIIENPHAKEIIPPYISKKRKSILPSISSSLAESCTDSLCRDPLYIELLAKHFPCLEEVYSRRDLFEETLVVSNYLGINPGSFFSLRIHMLLKENAFLDPDFLSNHHSRVSPITSPGSELIGKIFELKNEGTFYAAISVFDQRLREFAFSPNNKYH